LQAATTLCGETAAQVPSNSLRCATLVAMVQTAGTDSGQKHDHAHDGMAMEQETLHLLGVSEF
jgi:hypothetical protein